MLQTGVEIGGGGARDEVAVRILPLRQVDDVDWKTEAFQMEC